MFSNNYLEGFIHRITWDCPTALYWINVACRTHKYYHNIITTHYIYRTHPHTHPDTRKYKVKFIIPKLTLKLFPFKPILSSFPFVPYLLLRLFPQILTFLTCSKVISLRFLLILCPWSIFLTTDFVSYHTTRK